MTLDRHPSDFSETRAAGSFVLRDGSDANHRAYDQKLAPSPLDRAEQFTRPFLQGDVK